MDRQYMANSAFYNDGIFLFPNTCGPVNEMTHKYYILKANNFLVNRNKEIPTFLIKLILPLLLFSKTPEFYNYVSSSILPYT